MTIEMMEDAMWDLTKPTESTAASNYIMRFLARSMSHAEKILGGRGGSGFVDQETTAEAYQESADARGTAPVGG
jgi:hypothetical protein